MRWQQEMFRQSINDIQLFQNRFFSFTGNQAYNVMSRANWSTLNATVTQPGSTTVARGVTVTASADAPPGRRDIQVLSAARADLHRSGSMHGDRGVAGNQPLDASVFARTYRVNTQTDAERIAMGYVRVDNNLDPDYGYWFHGGDRAINPDGYLLNAQGNRVVQNAGGGTFTMSINGRPREINITGVEGLTNTPADNQSIVNQINAALVGFGYNPNDVQAELDGNGRLVFQVAAGHNIAMVSGSGETLQNLGFASGQSLSFNANQSFSHFMGIDVPGTAPGSVASTFNVNGVEFEFTRTRANEAIVSGQPGYPGMRTVYTETLRVVSRNGTAVPANTPPLATGASLNIHQIMNGINSADAGVRMSFSNFTGRFTVEGTQMGAGNEIAFSGDFFTEIGFTQEHASANAHIRINEAGGVVDIIRATNNFTVDGLTFQLDPHELRDVNPSDPTTFLELEIDLQRDTGNAMNLIRNFINAYNEMIRDMRAMTEVPRPRMQGTRQFFMPLTDDQRRSMSDREVELWETQARTGLLHRNDEMRSFTRDLHNWIMRPVTLANGSELSLLQMGITTSRNLQEFGQLDIDEDRLQYFLDNRIEDVEQLFRGPDALPSVSGDRNARLRAGGLGQRINDIMNWAADTNGTFTQRAGRPGGPSEHQNAISRRIAAEDRRIDTMIRNLERREARYFQQFSRMEVAMMQANSQMMFMEQMFFMG
jgi:flagellar capping protein FliD